MAAISTAKPAAPPPLSSTTSGSTAVVAELEGSSPTALKATMLADDGEISKGPDRPEPSTSLDQDESDPARAEELAKVQAQKSKDPAVLVNVRIKLSSTSWHAAGTVGLIARTATLDPQTTGRSGLRGRRSASRETCWSDSRSRRSRRFSVRCAEGLECHA